jgi:hypothetical protein
VEQLCLALNDEFQQYLPELLPRCIAVLTDAERTGVYTKVPAVLHTFEVLGGMFPFLLLCYKSSCFLSVWYFCSLLLMVSGQLYGLNFS